jgi:hypothetical protein
MAASDSKWVARLSPTAGRTVEDLLRLPLGLDVWQRDENSLIVSASGGALDEIERRRLAQVERICTAAEYELRMTNRT